MFTAPPETAEGKSCCADAGLGEACELGIGQGQVSSFSKGSQSLFLLRFPCLPEFSLWLGQFSVATRGNPRATELGGVGSGNEFVWLGDHQILL